MAGARLNSVESQSTRHSPCSAPGCREGHVTCVACSDWRHWGRASVSSRISRALIGCLKGQVPWLALLREIRELLEALDPGPRPRKDSGPREASAGEGGKTEPGAWDSLPLAGNGRSQVSRALPSPLGVIVPRSTAAGSGVKGRPPRKRTLGPPLTFPAWPVRMPASFCGNTQAPHQGCVTFDCYTRFSFCDFVFSCLCPLELM